MQIFVKGQIKHSNEAEVDFLLNINCNTPYGIIDDTVGAFDIQPDQSGCELYAETKFIEFVEDGLNIITFNWIMETERDLENDEVSKMLDGIIWKLNTLEGTFNILYHSVSANPTAAITVQEVKFNDILQDMEHFKAFNKANQKLVAKFS